VQRNDLPQEIKKQCRNQPVLAFCCWILSTRANKSLLTKTFALRCLLTIIVIIWWITDGILASMVKYYNESFSTNYTTTCKHIRRYSSNRSQIEIAIKSTKFFYMAMELIFILFWFKYNRTMVTDAGKASISVYSSLLT